MNVRNKGRAIAVIVLGLAMTLLGIANPRAAEHPSKQNIDKAFTTHSLTVAGAHREYVVFRPPSLNPSQPAPAVIMFHGGGGTAQHAIEETDWPGSAARHGFLAVFPEGIRPHPNRRASFMRNPQTWNDGSGRYYAGEIKSDDIGFTRALIADLATKYKLDRRRVYVTGFSNGASMAFRVGAELSDLVAAIAPVAASGLRIAEVHLRRPVPLLYIHGTADPRNPLEGGDVENKWAKGGVDRRPPLRDSLARWAALSGCKTETTPLQDKAGVTEAAYQCPPGMAVQFNFVSGLGHVWPGGTTALPESLVGKPSALLNANEIIWSFFQEHGLP